VKLSRAAVLWLFLSAVAFAQSRPGVKRAATTPWRDVERGLYLRGAAGPFFLANPPTTPGKPNPFSSGQFAQIELGYDFNEYFSAGLFMMASANQESSSYIGKSGGIVQGDFFTLVPGVAVRASFVGFADSNNVKRTWLYLRGGAGYAKFYPTALLPDSDVLLFVGPGIEYFTHLRHFSIGLEVSGTYLAKGKTYGFAIAPNLRYAF
jgi:hypothetical protein